MAHMLTPLDRWALMLAPLSIIAPLSGETVVCLLIIMQCMLHLTVVSNIIAIG